MKRTLVAGIVVAGIAVVVLDGGCVNVKAPEQISVGNGGSSKIDSTRIPPTANHEEAKRELRRAYYEINRLKKEIEDLEEDKDELKAEREEYKRKYDRLKDRYDD